MRFKALVSSRKVGAFLTRIFELKERRCAFCHEPFVPQERETLAALFCSDCRPFFQRRVTGYCPHCGELSALAEAPVVPCGECLQKLPPWDDFLFQGVYTGPLRSLILRGKFEGSLASLNTLGRMLAARCEEHYSVALPPQVLVPMPLHLSRLRERGLDQCLEMGRAVAEKLHIPLRKDLLRRIEASASQSSLNREKRKKLKQVFVASPEVRGLRVLLLDDICTTGATLARAAECLRTAGALSVDVVVAARTSRHDVDPRQHGAGRTMPCHDQPSPAMHNDSLF